MDASKSKLKFSITHYKIHKILLKKYLKFGEKRLGRSLALLANEKYFEKDLLESNLIISFILKTHGISRTSN